MKKQIVRVSLVQTAKVAAGIYFVLSLPLVALMLLLAPMLPLGRIGIGALLVWPLAYAVAAFLMTLLSGGLYNLVARFVGGIEFVTKEVVTETTSY